MSIEAIDGVRRRRDIPRPLKEFLKAVAFYVPADGSAVPIYIARLADDMELSERRIQQMQVACAAAGWLSYTPTGHKGQNVYTLAIAKPASRYAEDAETRNRLRDSDEAQRDNAKPASRYAEDAAPIAKPASRYAEKRETGFAETQNAKPASPLFDSDSDFPPIQEDSDLGGTINQSDSERGEAGFAFSPEVEAGFADAPPDAAPLPDAALPFASWLANAGMGEPCCSELARLAFEQDATLDTLKRARIVAYRVEAEGGNWQGYLVNAVRNSGWAAVAARCDNPSTGLPLPQGSRARKRRTGIAAFYDALL